MSTTLKRIEGLNALLQDKVSGWNAHHIYLRGDGDFVDTKGTWVSPFEVLTRMHKMLELLNECQQEVYRYAEDVKKGIA